MGSHQSCPMYHFTPQVVNSINATEQAKMNSWLATVAQENGGGPLNNSSSFIKQANGTYSAFGQISYMLQAALETPSIQSTQPPPFTTFDILLNTFQNIITTLLQNPVWGEDNGQQGVFLSSSGYDVTKFYYYLNAFVINDQYNYASTSTNMVAYAYAVVPITAPMTEQNIRQYMQQMILPPPLEKDAVAKKLYDIYLSSLSPQQLQQILQQQQSGS